MTDERLGDRVLQSAQALPFGSGIIFRHYSLPSKTRRQLFYQLRRIARRRGHMILLSGEERVARRLHADGFHLRQSARRRNRRMIHSAGVHNLSEINVANRSGVDMQLLSPVFATASHPGTRSLGPMAFSSKARLCKARVIALGGMTARRFTMLRTGSYGWAAIDALAKSLTK